MEELNIEEFQKLTVSLRGNIEVKTNIIVFTFKGQLDAFSEKQFKSFVTNNLRDDLPFVIDFNISLDLIPETLITAIPEIPGPDDKAYIVIINYFYF